MTCPCGETMHERARLTLALWACEACGRREGYSTMALAAAAQRRPARTLGQATMAATRILRARIDRAAEVA